MLWKQSFYPFLLALLEYLLLFPWFQTFSEDKSSVEALGGVGSLSLPVPWESVSCWDPWAAPGTAAGSDPCPQAVPLALGPCPAHLGFGDLTTHTLSPCPALSHSCCPCGSSISFQFPVVCVGFCVWLVGFFFFSKIVLLQNLLVVEELLCLFLVWV